MKIFPLGTAGKIVLVFIALILGLIWSMLQFPDFWKRMLGRKKEEDTKPPAPRK